MHIELLSNYKCFSNIARNELKIYYVLYLARLPLQVKFIKKLATQFSTDLYLKPLVVTPLN